MHWTEAFKEVIKAKWCPKGHLWSSKIRSRKEEEEGHSWWLSGKEIPCQCRGYGFNPWSRKISHAAEQLSSCTTTTGLGSRAWQPQLLSPHTATTKAWMPRACVPQQEKPPWWDTLIPQLDSGPPWSPQLEKSMQSGKDLEQPKLNK